MRVVSIPSLSGVRNGPGASAFTVMPVPASSTARLRVSWTTAPLLAAYPARPAPPTSPSALARVRMRPYPASRMGPAAARQASQVPTTLTSRHARRSAADSSSIVPRACTPALVTSTSSRPYTKSARSTSPATAFSSVTSHAWPSTGRPVWAASRPAACSQRSAQRLASTTADPDRARAPAIARPRPAEPPVTTDTCPARGEAAGQSAGEGLRDSSLTQECSQNRLLARRSISRRGLSAAAARPVGVSLPERPGPLRPR